MVVFASLNQAPSGITGTCLMQRTWMHGLWQVHQNVESKHEQRDTDGSNVDIHVHYIQRHRQQPRRRISPPRHVQGTVPHTLLCRLSGVILSGRFPRLLWAFELKIGTPVTPNLTWETFTPILVSLRFFIFELGARTGQTDRQRQTDGQDA